MINKEKGSVFSFFIALITAITGGVLVYSHATTSPQAVIPKVQQAVIQNNSPKEGSLKVFSNAQFTIQYPKDWAVNDSKNTTTHRENIGFKSGSTTSNTWSIDAYNRAFFTIDGLMGQLNALFEGYMQKSSITTAHGITATKIIISSQNVHAVHVIFVGAAAGKNNIYDLVGDNSPEFVNFYNSFAFNSTLDI